MKKLRAVRGIEEVLHRARSAEDELASWADEVRVAAEVRMGIGRDDERAWDDPAYAAALDRYGEFRRTRERIEEVLERLTTGPDRAPGKEE